MVGDGLGNSVGDGTLLELFGMANGVISGEGKVVNGFGNGDETVLLFEEEADDGFCSMPGECFRTTLEALIAFGNVFEQLADCVSFEVLGIEMAERVIVDGIFANILSGGGKYLCKYIYSIFIKHIEQTLR